MNEIDYLLATRYSALLRKVSDCLISPKTELVPTLNKVKAVFKADAAVFMVWRMSGPHPITYRCGTDDSALDLFSNIQGWNMNGLNVEEIDAADELHSVRQSVDGDVAVFDSHWTISNRESIRLEEPIDILPVKKSWKDHYGSWTCVECEEADVGIGVYLFRRNARGISYPLLDLLLDFGQHIKCAIRVELRTQHWTNLAHTGFGIYDQYVHPLMLLDASRHVIYSNNAAKIARQRGENALTLHRGAITTHDPSARQAFLDIVASMGNTNIYRAMPLQLFNGAGQPHTMMIMTAGRFRSGVTGSELLRGHVAVVNLSLTYISKDSFCQVLMLLYQLTQKETDVAYRLVLMDTPEEASENLNVKISTTRSHIKSIMDKMNVSKQTELFARLSALTVSESA